MFSVRSLTCAAISASRSTRVGGELQRHALGLQQRRRIAGSARPCGSVRMRTKSSLRQRRRVRRGSGNGPAVPGSGRDGLARWNAPEAMNRMWSVLTVPYLVLTCGAFHQRQQVALHAFAADVGAAHVAAALGDLVDLVDEDDAVLLAGFDRGVADLVLVDQLGRPLPRPAAGARP